MQDTPATRGKLYVVGTPIGNLDDLTPRAREVLAAADVIAAEDTRRTRGLLSRIGVEARLIAYHEHNEEKRIDELLERLAGGESVALVSDAGTPLISDPGWRLVRARARGGPRRRARCRVRSAGSPPPAPPACRPIVSCSRDSFCRRRRRACATDLRELRHERRAWFLSSRASPRRTLAALGEHFGVPIATPCSHASSRRSTSRFARARSRSRRRSSAPSSAAWRVRVSSSHDEAMTRPTSARARDLRPLVPSSTRTKRCSSRQR
jgi:hypothetical protein